MARALRVYYGPRQAIWTVILDGRAVTTAFGPYGAAGALRQALEAQGEGRSAACIRTEFCPACGTREGIYEVPRRGRMFPVEKTCPSHMPALEMDELWAAG